MPELLAILSGVILSVMFMVNGDLSSAYGELFSMVFIHVTGLIITCVIVLFTKEKRKKGKIPLWVFTGGMIGVFTTYSNIVTVNELGVSITVALGLAGQCVLSLFIDTFGWFGVKKQQFIPQRVIGLVFIAAGVLTMLVI